MSEPRSLAGGWFEYRRIIDPDERASPRACKELEQAFFAGAVSAFGIILNSAREGHAEGVAGIKRMREELTAFADRTIADLEGDGQ